MIQIPQAAFYVEHHLPIRVVSLTLSPLVTRSYPVTAISNGTPYMGDKAGNEKPSGTQSKQIVRANSWLLNATATGSKETEFQQMDYAK